VDVLLAQNVLLARGIAIGFTIAAPIGPVCILCVKRALSHGRWAGIPAALGAAFADSAFGAVVGLGIGVIPVLLSQYQTPLRIIGGLFLVILGVLLWRNGTSSANGCHVREGTWARDCLSSFVITITNPGTMLGVVGVFAALGPMGQVVALSDRIMLIGGIFLGSVLWWTVLSSVASAFRHRITPQGVHRFSQISGVVLLALGIGVLGTLAL
jgi:threonine/homoserine/homoserine lactone efflux protein